MKKRIILIGDYNRNDFNYVAKELKDEIDFFFLEYLNAKKIKNKGVYALGTPIFWKNYSDAYEMLEEIKPDKVLFYFIETYNHVALNVACKVRNIPTFHIDHGVRFSLAFYEERNKKYPDQRGGKRVFKDYIYIIKELSDRLKTKRFFFNTIKKSPLKEAQSLKDYQVIRKANNIFNTFKKVKTFNRVANSYISFSPKVFESYSELDHLPTDYPVNYIGIPVFDYLARLHYSNLPVGRNILFIDQPLVEQNHPGWTKEFKQQFLENLSNLCSDLDSHMYIKPHPLNDIRIYKILENESNISIINKFDESLLKDVGVILGFSSTLLMPFIAMNEKAVFIINLGLGTGDMVISPFTKYLEESWPVEVIHTFEEFKPKIKNRELYLQKQKWAKSDFVSNWLYKFDGKSTERLKALLLR